MNGKTRYKKAPEFESVMDAEAVLKKYPTVEKLRAYRQYLEGLGFPGLDTYTHRALADRLGVSREKVCRALKELRDGPIEGGE